MIELLENRVHYDSLEDMKKGINGISEPPSDSEVVDKINELIRSFNRMDQEYQAFINHLKSK